MGNSTYLNSDNSTSHYITTSHSSGIEDGFTFLSIDKELYNSALLQYNHSHPSDTPFPSGLPGSRYLGGDIPFAKNLINIAISNLQPIPQFQIFVQGKGYRRFHINSTQKQFDGMPSYYYEK